MKSTTLKKKMMMLFVCVITLATASCGTIPNSAGTAGNNTQPTETAQVTPTNSSYAIGQTWTVEGQWSLTINSVTETESRNEYSDKNPGAVYIVDYSYTNLGYADKSGLMDGLYIGLDEGIVDAAGVMGYEYPGDISQYPQEAPIGATCNAQACIGVGTPGSFTINVRQYDGNGNKQSASFDITV